MPSGGTTRLGRESGPRSFGVLPFAMWLRKQERLCLEKKGERTLAGGP